MKSLECALQRIHSILLGQPLQLMKSILDSFEIQEQIV
jgi:hypothetical protein